MPSQDGEYVLLWQCYDNNKMVAMRYYGNVMTSTMSQYSDDVSSVSHAGCICAPVILHLQQYSHRLNLLYSFFNSNFINDQHVPLQQYYMLRFYF